MNHSDSSFIMEVMSFDNYHCISRMHLIFQVSISKFSWYMFSKPLVPIDTRKSDALDAKSDNYIRLAFTARTTNSHPVDPRILARA